MPLGATPAGGIFRNRIVSMDGCRVENASATGLNLGDLRYGLITGPESDEFHLAKPNSTLHCRNRKRGDLPDTKNDDFQRKSFFVEIGCWDGSWLGFARQKISLREVDDTDGAPRPQPTPRLRPSSKTVRTLLECCGSTQPSIDRGLGVANGRGWHRESARLLPTAGLMRDCHSDAFPGIEWKAVSSHSTPGLGR